MKKVTMRVGEHRALIVCHSLQVFGFIQKNYEPFFAEIERPDMVIQIEDGYGIPFVDYQVDVKQEEDTIFFQRADYIIQANLSEGEAQIQIYDELALKHALMNFYSSYIVYHNWGLLIHSSCAIEKEKAHLFAGSSGAGKSTCAQLSAPRPILSDEATLVKIEENQITVFNSPFRSELSAPSIKETIPLASIQLLHQALNNERTKLGKASALLQIMDKVFYWNKDREETKKIVQMIKEVLDHVPVYDLYFQKNNTFWELIS
ncbi:hypothetical protein AAB109_05755 [Priestia megaterium]|uniref:hypothetical protein n=1 Tax=Priestia megaterium TaxID=1404 RepID=UPI002ACD7351|nr:hypothetical protein [Priestia megaterium]